MKGRYVILPAADRDIDSQALYYADEAGVETATAFSTPSGGPAKRS